MPVFRGSVALPARGPAQLRLAPAPALQDRAWQSARARALASEDELWSRALAEAKARALVEEEERAWQTQLEHVKAQLAAQEEQEWAALRARTQPAARRPSPLRGRVCTWP
jgi:hypothetical protein